MNTTTLHTRFIAFVLAAFTTAGLLGAIDGLAGQPEPGSVLAQLPSPSMPSAQAAASVGRAERAS